MNLVPPNARRPSYIHGMDQQAHGDRSEASEIPQISYVRLLIQGNLAPKNPCATFPIHTKWTVKDGDEFLSSNGGSLDRDWRNTHNFVNSDWDPRPQPRPHRMVNAFFVCSKIWLIDQLHLLLTSLTSCLEQSASQPHC